MRRYNNALTYFNQVNHTEIDFGSPFELSNVTREEKRDYLVAKNCFVAPKRHFSFDTNLWCREFESGSLKAPVNLSIDEELYRWGKVAKLSDRVTIEYKQGIPVALNSKKLELSEMIPLLHELGGAYKLGRTISLEQSPLETKVVEVHESPAAHILFEAYYEAICGSFDQSTVNTMLTLSHRWAELCAHGQWYSCEKMAIDQFMKSLATQVNGVVTLNLMNNSVSLFSLELSKCAYTLDRDQEEILEAA